MASPDLSANFPSWHGTTILTVRKGDQVVIGGDGQVSIGQTIVKSTARKVRRLGKGDVIGGFAGATADAFTLFERLEGKLEQYPGQLLRASVELAKEWRSPAISSGRWPRTICRWCGTGSSNHMSSNGGGMPTNSSHSCAMILPNTR